MNSSPLLEFSFISLVLVVSPGPNLALITKTLSHLGARHSLANITGFFIATFIHGALAILGLSIIIINSPKIYFTIKILGAAYLMYLGIKTIANVISRKTTMNDSFKKILGDASLVRYRESFLEGFFTQILNPKVLVFYLAVFPQFLSSFKNYFYSFILVLIHASIIFSWFSGMTILSHKITKTLSRSGLMIKVLQVLMGLVLFYFGIIMMTI